MQTQHNSIVRSGDITASSGFIDYEGWNRWIEY